MSRLRMIYLGFAIWGAVHPLVYIWQWIAAGGSGPMDLIATWRSGPASSALFWDLTIAAMAISVWILAEVLVRRNWSALWAIVATWTLGVGCGLPLYLFLRTRPVT
jgi:hypothetical protein